MEEQLQNEENQEQVENTCGGLEKPNIPKGWYGDYECINDVWVWVPLTV